MDRRLTPFSGRIAHVSLAGKVTDTPLTSGEEARVTSPIAPLREAPEGGIDRHLLYGDSVTIIDRRQRQAFVMAAKDGYCGWLRESDLGKPEAPSHWIATPATHLYPEPRVQAPPSKPLFLTSRVKVLAVEGAWARTPSGFLPAGHLLPLDQFSKEPAQVAESLLHAPYLWAGNAVSGVDCSGMVQLSYHACGIPCPADSDLQRRIGRNLAEGETLRRNDLLFWKGHVAMMLDETRIIHANGYRMAVSIEPLEEAQRRIATQYGSDILARRRVIE